eukprot:gene32296-16864_t
MSSMQSPVPHPSTPDPIEIAGFRLEDRPNLHGFTGPRCPARCARFINAKSAEREAQVLECLQGEACQLKNVSRNSDGRVATVHAFIDRQESGAVLHELDKIGVGTAFGKVAMVPLMLLKPLPKTGDIMESSGAAGWIAALGLATNSTVMIVASMLISPLMGPILAACFATNVRDTGLIKKGILVELLGVGITFMVGLMAGVLSSIWHHIPDN